MKIYDIRINGMENPLGFDFDTLLCSWKVRESEGNEAVSATITVWNSGQEVLWQKTGALDSTGTPIAMELQPRTRYYYQVSVTSDAGDHAESPLGWFETAKMDEPWQAEWITRKGDSHPEFQKTFSLSKPVKEARLYICGLGLFEARINGVKAGDDFLAPFINDYKEHVQYCTYDVGSLLNRPENTLTVDLGKGWMMGRFGLTNHAYSGWGFALIAELHCRYEDGTEDVIVTDSTWQSKESIFELTDIYDGETQNWTRQSEWGPVEKTEVPVPLIARYSIPVHTQEVLPVQEVIHTPAGETVLDFGQEFAGYVRADVQIPKGESLKLEFGEILQDGNFYHANYRTAKSEFLYISDGEKREIRPHFTFFGFRYVKVTGPVEPSAFTGHVVYSDMKQTAFFQSGDPKVNRLFLNALWGMKSNFLDMPTDCPQRDERLGWSGDAMVFCTTAGFLMDTRAFYHKFLRDLRSDQRRNDGKVAIYLPNEFPGLAASVWSDVGTFLPDMLYRYYGSREMLESHYPLMKGWVDYLHGEDVRRGEQDLYNWGFQFGDWLAQDGPTSQSRIGRTDKYYLSSLYYYGSTQIVANAAKALEKPEAEKYEELAGKIRSAILKEYFTGSGRLSVDTQTGYLAALRFGVYIDKEKIVDGLKNRIQQDCRRLTGGFVGATMMNHVLAQNGMEREAYDFLFYEGFPGWLYAVNLGATTIWERWNSVLPDGHLSGTEMNSLNHYSYGSVVEFLIRDTAGINETAPGFRSVVIEPKPDVRLKHVDFSYDSVSGTYVSNWEICEDGTLKFHIEIPFGCEAEIRLPEQPPIFVKTGSYDYFIRTERDYRSLYDEKTSLETLFADPRALKVLEEDAPEVIKSTDRSDREAMSKGLNLTQYRYRLFRVPTTTVDRAICDLKEIKEEL